MTWLDPTNNPPNDSDRLIEAQVALGEWIIGTPVFNSPVAESPGELVRLISFKLYGPPIGIDWAGGRFPWDRVIRYRVFGGWRWNDADHYDTFYPIPGHDESREVYALLDQSMLGDEDEDEINIPQVIIGDLESELLENDPTDGPIHSWAIRTPDGAFDLGTRIAAWRFLTKLLPGM